MKRIMVTGPRWFDNVDIIGAALGEALVSLGEDTAELVHGGCRGADLTARDYWVSKGRPHHEFPAPWGHGRFAGPARNELMAASRPDVCVAFLPVPLIGGTADCVRRATAHEVPVRTVLIGDHP